MTELVKIQEEKALTTSLKVAEVFEKEHRNVVRDVEKLLKELSELGSEDVLNFEQMSYKDSYGRSHKAYQMNKNGFILLAMSFTGTKALKFKLDYIKAFDAMEEQIREMQKNVLTKNETALVFQMINFFRYLNHCRQIEQEHKRVYIQERLSESHPYQMLVKEFYKMRNNLLEIGDFKSLQEKYKEYYLKHPNQQYNPKMNKFSLIFTMDKYEPLRHAIADFLKLELQPDGYSLKMASEAKALACLGKVQIEPSNESNLFRDKEEDLIGLGSLKVLASSLLQLEL